MASINKERLEKLMSLDIKDIEKIFKNSSFKKKVKKAKVFNKKAISIDIGSEVIKLVVGKNQRGKIIVDKLITIPTPEGAVIDGAISNVLTLKKAISDVLESNEINLKDCICTTNSTTIINREITIPKVEEEEEETLIKYEIQQYLPINMNDYIVQHSILSTFNVEEKEKCNALVVTYPEKMANGYYKLLTETDLRPVALDVTYNSINKLINQATKINEEEYSIRETVAFIDMGAENLNVNIYNNGLFEFSRIIRSGGSNIDHDISKNFHLSLQEAEQRKKISGNLLNKDQEENTLNALIQETVDQWLEELERIIQFYKNKRVGNNISKIYLYGGGALLKGIEEYFSEKLKLPVKKITTLDNVELSNKIIGEQLGVYLNALGALIRI